MNENRSDLMLKVAALSIGVLLYTGSIIQASMGAIALAFPETDVETIKLLQTITPIIMMISSFACGQLARFIRKKVILVGGIALILIGGLLPAFMGDTFQFLLIMKGIFSVGYGLCFPFASSILVDLFPDGPVRHRMVGFKTAVGGLSSVIFSAMGGYLANINYRYSYAAFLLVVPVLILIFLKLPDSEQVKTDVRVPPEQKDKLTAKTLGLALWNITFNVTLNAFFASIALVVVKTGAGDSARAGLTISAYSAVSFLVGIFFSRIRKLLKHYTLAFAVASVGVCFLILVNAQTFNMYILGSLFFGLGFGMYNPELLLLVAQTIKRPEGIVPVKSAATLAFSVIIVFQAIGQSFSQKILGAAVSVFGLEGLKAGWQVSSVYLLIAAPVIAVAATILSREKKQADRMGSL